MSLFFKERYDFWAPQNFAVNIKCSFFPEFLPFFSPWCYDLWFIFLLDGICGQFSYMPVWCPFYSMDLLAAGAKGYQVQRMRSERMKEDDKLRVYWHVYLLCHIQPNLPFIIYNIYNSAPSWHSQAWCKRPRITISAWDRSSWQHLRQTVFSSSGWKLKFPNVVKLAYCCICRWGKKEETNENILLSLIHI